MKVPEKAKDLATPPSGLPLSPQIPPLVFTPACVCRLFHVSHHLPHPALALLSLFLRRSPFPTAPLFLWGMYSLWDNNGLIGNSGPAFLTARLSAGQEASGECNGITHLMSSLKGTADCLHTAARLSIANQSKV